MSRIKSIKLKKIVNERLYNLAVNEDESFIAQGIIVHNCRCLLVPITKFEEYKLSKINMDKLQDMGGGLLTF